ncbi:MAG: hypothetical protein ACRENE_13430 [Polyangiaceae bacterium]
MAASLLSLSGLVAGASLVACFDLLHATGDLRTACEVDASAAGCACAASHADARRLAEHACGWLGACETPMGGNAAGPCMFSALLAFDCAANPDHLVKGEPAAIWQCLAAADTCGAVDGCLFPGGPRATCGAGGSYTSCVPLRDAGASTGDVRVECDDGGASSAHGENCALWGLTCSLSDAPARTAVCAPSARQGCSANDCAGSRIDWCRAGANVGIDCAGWGRQACGVFPSAGHPGWAACLPEGDPGAACAPTLDAGCSQGVALSCPTGTPERLDCAALLGSRAAASCQPGELDPPFDWAGACRIEPPACAGDACDGGVAIGCARGAAFSVDCVSAGLGACVMRSTDLGTNRRAACTPPPR